MERDREMHYFEYEFKINPEILSMITLLHEYKGRQELLSGANQDELTTLESMVKKEMAESSTLRGGYQDGYTPNF